MEEFLAELYAKLGEFASTAGVRILVALIVLVVGWKLCKLPIRAAGKSKGFQKLDVGVQTFLKSFINIALKVLLFVTVAAILGVPMTSFVTILGSAGLTIGLALQGSLSNFAGGIMILVFHPFRVGDYIEFSDGAGTVRGITILYTTLTTPDNVRVVVPNGSLSNATVKNYSAEDVRRAELVLSVAYGTDVELAKRILSEVASAHPKVLREPAPFCRLAEQGEDGLNLKLRVWTKNAEYWNVYFDLQEQTLAALEQNGISIPFPQLDVHVRK